MGNSTPCKIVTFINIILKLCMFVITSARLFAIQFLVPIGTVGAYPQICEILPLCDFFDCPVLTLFSMLRLGRTARLIFTLYGPITKNPPQQLTLSGTTVDQVDTFKLLGVHVSADLKWTQNVNAISAKAASRIYIF